MTFEQTVTIPADRHIFLDFLAPKEIPAGKARLELTLTPETTPQRGTVKPLASFFGVDKDLDTMDAYFARKRANKTQENNQFERMRS
jgi:hypothetical protein